MSRISDSREAFEAIYADSVWGPGSGVGSMPEYTTQYVTLIDAFLRDHAIASVVDFGCGDWQFSRSVNWGGAQYDGFDVVETVIAANTAAFGTDRVRFHLLTDATVLPRADLLLCKDVLQHLPLEDIKHYLKIFKRQYTCMLITNDVAPAGHMNGDVEHGQWRPLRLDLKPFRERCARVLTWDIDAYGSSWTKHTYLLSGGRDSAGPPPAIGDVEWLPALAARLRRRTINRLRRVARNVPGLRAAWRLIRRAL